MILLEARNLTQTYTVGERTLNVLKDVSLSVQEGEFLVIAGSSGSGKSTLLSLLSGLDRPSSGSVLFRGKDITDADEDDLAQLRNEAIGFVFQSFHLVPSLNALENVMFPAELNGDPHARDRAEHLLSQVGLHPRMDNFPHQLSGGEKQRVAICRSLINRPAVIFADEPTGNLDSDNGRAILQLLETSHRAEGATLVMVTHDREIASAAGRILTLEDGRLSSPKTHAA